MYLRAVLGRSCSESFWFVTACAAIAVGCQDASPPGDDEIPPDDIAPEASQLCAGGWCWEYPRPLGNDLRAVWSFGESDVWAAGDDATVIHWDGSSWRYAGPIEAGQSAASFAGMWASGPSDLWLWGPAGFWRWDGASWSAMTPDPDRQVTAVFGTTATSVLAVGEGGLLARWDGAQWTVETLGAGYLSGVWAAGAEVWAVGPASGDGFEDVDSIVWHFDGGAWSSEIRDEALGGVWGAATDDVYAYGGGVLHWDGNGWAPLALPVPYGTVWGTSASDVWLFETGSSSVLHFDGDSWRPADLPALWSANGAAGLGPDDTWIVGAQGRIARWDGGAWTRYGGPLLGSELALPGYGLWGANGNDLWAGGDAGGLVHWDGTEWQAEPASGNYAAVWGSGDSLWAAGGYGARAFHRDATWDVASLGGPPHFYDVWASSSRDAWAVGDAIHHHDGRDWEQTKDLSELGIAMRGVWGNRADDVWAVGDRGTVLRWDGSSWDTLPTGHADALTTVWASGAADVWAAGTRLDGGTVEMAIHRWDGARWTAIETPAGGGRPDALWGSGPDSIWLAATGPGGLGEMTRVHHWDGAGWTERPLPIHRHVGALWGWARDAVAVTSNGGLLRYYPTAD